MTLQSELLAALDNPTGIWNGLIRGLDLDTRTTLMVLAAHPTPTAVTTLEEAVARLDVRLLGSFVDSLRKLDDLFTRTYRSRSDVMIAFRNPSMEEFCLAFLNERAELALQIAHREPTIAQTAHLTRISLAKNVGRPGRRYQKLHDRLIGDPTELLTRLCEFDTLGHVGINALLDLLTHTGETTASVAAARAHLRSLLTNSSFSNNSTYVAAALRDRSTISYIFTLLDHDFTDFYDSLWRSADQPGEFESLVTLEEEVGTLNPPWIDRFHDCVLKWVADLEDAEGCRALESNYNDLIDRLGVDDRHYIDWDDVASELPHPEEYDDDEARKFSRGAGGAMGGTEPDVVDSLFRGLLERD